MHPLPSQRDMLTKSVGQGRLNSNLTASSPLTGFATRLLGVNASGLLHPCVGAGVVDVPGVVCAEQMHLLRSVSETKFVENIFVVGHWLCGINDPCSSMASQQQPTVVICACVMKLRTMRIAPMIMLCFFIRTVGQHSSKRKRKMFGCLFLLDCFVFE